MAQKKKLSGKTLEKKLSGKTLKNSHGQDVAIEHIRKDVIRKDKIVKRVFVTLDKLQRRMIAEKAKVRKQIAQHVEKLLKENGIEDKKKLNVTLTTFDGQKQIIVKSNRIMEFDEKLQVAEAKIKKCMRTWAVGANPALCEIVDNVFRTEKKGFIDKSGILSLLQYNISDREWREAMELIRQSMYTADRKEYLMIKFRDDASGKWQSINLNFSTL